MAELSPLDAPVRTVTLLEDRAQVARVASATLPAGRSQWRIVGVSPVLSDKTCAVVVAAGATGATVDDVRVRRRWRPPEDRAGDLATLERELREKRGERSRQAADLERASTRISQQDGLVSQSLGEMTEDVGWGRGLAADWQGEIDALVTDGRARRAAHLEARFRLADLDTEIGALERRIAEARGGDPAREAWIEVDITAPQAGAYELRCEYVVPGACWRPYHVARLDESGDSPQVHWRTEACTWQRTGEDWTDVELRFSTERLSLGAEPPRLATDELERQRKSEALEVEAREQAVQTTGLGRAAGTAAAELPGVDDGGTTCTLRSPTRATIPADGRPHRVPLAEFTVPATVSRVALPELTPAVLWKSVQTNGGTAPVLAGPVDLIRRHGMVGRTTVLYVAPGAQFELGWGPDPDLRVRREQHEHPPSKGMLSSWTSREQHVTLRFSNLANQAVTFTCTERLPVSEIEKVEIAADPKKTTDGSTPDADGFVRWTVELPPHGTRTLELYYTIKTHKDVVWA